MTAPTTTRRTVNGKPKPRGAPPGWGRFIKGNRTQVALSIEPSLLQEIDALAKRRHVSRSALLTMWASERLEEEKARFPKS